MAIIVGLEEKERILKSIEDKIKEVEELNAFLTGLEQGDSTVIITCMDQAKKRHRINIRDNHSAIAAFVKEQREELVTEIVALCKVNNIALNEKELQILGITEYLEPAVESYPEMEQENNIESYDNTTIYEDEQGYSHV